MSKSYAQLLSPKALMKLIGGMAFLLPYSLMLVAVVFGNCEFVQNSISSYYHTSGRDLFVGIISTIAFSLFAYRGYGPTDNLLANLAALLALGVAFFPTSVSAPFTQCLDKEINNGMISTLHFISAAGLFILLGIFSLFIFTKSKGIMTSGKMKRNRLYKVCGSLIFICIILIAIQFQTGILADYHPIFWLETVAINAFAISWLTKGEMIYGDLSTSSN